MSSDDDRKLSLDEIILTYLAEDLDAESPGTDVLEPMDKAMAAELRAAWPERHELTATRPDVMLGEETPKIVLSGDANIIMASRPRIVATPAEFSARAQEGVQAPETIPLAVLVAGARFDRWLALIPARLVPRRVQNEVIGDGLERIGMVVRNTGSKWRLRGVYLSIVVALGLEIVRHVARAIKGEKALK